MWEPRGHADMYGCLLTEPVTPDGDVGVLFMHNEGFSTMCGHGIIALTTVGIETGRFETSWGPPVVHIDTPAGRVTATAHLEGERVQRVSFLNVPSFVLERDLIVNVPGHGDLRCDIAFGGALYHITSRGDRREAISEDDEDREAFLGVLSEVVERDKWICRAFCLMTTPLCAPQSGAAPRIRAALRDRRNASSLHTQDQF